jgi:beta-phosphoglucomutase-like phosphatase (HAD superfamily)
MTINLIIFDLDGTLVDTCDIHYLALNEAIRVIAGPSFIISREDHLSQFNGLNTKKKLQILTKTRNLDPQLHHRIFSKKQELTEFYIECQVHVDTSLQQTLKDLKEKHGLKLYCATNCIKKIARLILTKLGIIELFDGIFTNEDVKEAKPSPEMYLKCISDAQNKFNTTFTCDTVLIFEDSPLGLQGAYNSECHVIKIYDPSELSYRNIIHWLCFL